MQTLQSLHKIRPEPRNQVWTERWFDELITNCVRQSGGHTALHTLPSSPS